MQLCKYCGVTKPAQEFEICKIINGVRYFRKKCKACKRLRQIARIQETRAWFESLKKTLKCVVCGCANFRCFVFHHPDPSKKEANVSELMDYGRKRIEKELAVCQCFCSNCHLILHYEERKTKSTKAAPQ